MNDIADRNAPARPRIFLSFAGSDRATARRLSEDLRRRGIDTYLDLRDSSPGCNVPLAINDALSHSDFYLLLWSQHTVDRDWVTVEWSAAFVREINERRSFLFVARLDSTPMPVLLAPRRYLDAFVDWEGCISELSQTWIRDQSEGTMVLPPPGPVTVHADTNREIYVRNHALSMSLVLSVAPAVTGKGLWEQIQAELELRDRVSMFKDTVGMRFSYELWNGRQPILGDSIDELHLIDGTTIDLVIEVELTSQAETISTWVWRNAAGPTQASGQGSNQKVIRALLDSAFSHLLPS